MIYYGIDTLERDEKNNNKVSTENQNKMIEECEKQLSASLRLINSEESQIRLMNRGFPTIKFMEDFPLLCYATTKSELRIADLSD